MPNPVTFGLIIPQRGSLFGLGSLRSLLQLGVRAEECDAINAVWVGDSFTSKSRPEAVTCLSALAGITDRVRLAVGCMATFPVRDPALFAFQWATLDQISNGRALLSVCNGFQPDGASAAEGRHLGGIPDKERPGRLEENIALCRKLWTGEPITFDGEFTHYEDIQILPTPVQEPCPIWITANPMPGRGRERVLERVATLADGFQTATMTPGALSTLRAELEPHLQRAGRTIDDFPLSVYHNINIGSSADDCLTESQQFALDYYGPGFMSGPALASMTAVGSPTECIAALGELIDQGANHIALRLTSYDQAKQLDLLIDEVLPAFV